MIDRRVFGFPGRREVAQPSHLPEMLVFKHGRCDGMIPLLIQEQKRTSSHNVRGSGSSGG